MEHSSHIQKIYVKQCHSSIKNRRVARISKNIVAVPYNASVSFSPGHPVCKLTQHYDQNWSKLVQKKYIWNQNIKTARQLIYFSVFCRRNYVNMLEQYVKVTYAQGGVQVGVKQKSEVVKRPVKRSLQRGKRDRRIGLSGNRPSPKKRDPPPYPEIRLHFPERFW